MSSDLTSASAHPRVVVITTTLLRHNLLTKENFLAELELLHIPSIYQLFLLPPWKEVVRSLVEASEAYERGHSSRSCRDGLRKIKELIERKIQTSIDPNQMVFSELDVRYILSTVTLAIHLLLEE